MTWWFLASDGSEIQASVEDFSPISLKFHIKYTLPTFSYLDKGLCIRGIWVVHFLLHNYLHTIMEYGLLCETPTKFGAKYSGVKKNQVYTMTGHALFYREIKTI